MDEFTGLSKLIQAVGIPTALTIFTIWGAFRVTKWIAGKLEEIGKAIAPLVMKTMTFLDMLDESLKQYSAALSDFSKTLSNIETHQVKISDSQRLVADQNKTLAEQHRLMEETLQEMRKQNEILRGVATVQSDIRDKQSRQSGDPNRR